MNKKEQKTYDEAITTAAVNRALSWSYERQEFDLMPPTESGTYANGWSLNLYMLSVHPSWSGVVSHGARDADQVVSNYRDTDNAAQNRIRQYSTKELALRALRCAVEQKAAEDLHRIDQLIQEEKTK